MSNLGIGTSKLKPKVADIDPSINIKVLSEGSFYTRFNYELVTENLNSLGESISIDFQGKDLQDFVEFKTNLVLSVDDISPLFNGISSTSYGDTLIGLSSFPLTYNSVSALKKSFSDLDIESNVSEELSFKKTNHGFSTGELLSYEYEGSPIEISPTEFSGIGVTSYLPSNVYAIKNTNNILSIASNESNAYNGIGVTFISVGAGTTHNFYSTNINTRSLILVDNLIQSPLYSKGIFVSLATTSVGILTTTIPLSGISSIRLFDFLFIDNEIMKVKSISSGTTSVTVERGSMGSVSAAHTDGSDVHFYSGNYNIVKDVIYFSSAPLTNSSFNGRIFYKKNYNKNVIFDDLASEFVGIAKTFILKYKGSNYGLSTSTVTGEQYGIVSLNGIFQKPTIDYNLQSTSGITTITFTGNTSFDIPNSGKILNFDYDQGSNYQPQVAAAGTVTISSTGTIDSVTLTGNGGGYLSEPKVTIASTIGTGSSIVALVGTGNSVGLITGFTITNPGIGYTTSSIPTLIVEAPYGYTNLPLSYVSGSNNGQEAKISVKIGSGGSITSVEVDDVGNGYKIGDILTISGIGTLSGYIPFTLTVTDTYSDSFSFWSFGQIKKTFIPDKPDGLKVIFQINDIDTSSPINFEKNNSDLRFFVENNLLIFVNGIMQRPLKDYTIRNSFLRFVEPIPKNQDLQVYIYTASNEDSVIRDVLPTVKSGDILRIKGNDTEKINQEPRGVYRIEGKNRIRTSSYNGLGINGSELAFRKIDWTKQTRDSIVSNRKIYKTREIYDPLIKPKSSLIVGIDTNSSEIYVENINLFDVDNITESQLQVEIVEDISLNQASATSVVSSAGTVTSINILNGGSGYSQSNPPTVSISKKEITKPVRLESFIKISSPSNIQYFDSKSSDERIVSVGSSLSYRYSKNLISFTNTSIASSSIDLKCVEYANNIWIVGGTNGYISTSTNLISWNPVGIASIDQGSFPETISPYTFNQTFNSLCYISGVFVGVGSGGKIFTYDTLNQARIERFGNNFIVRNSNTSQNLNKVITGEFYENGNVSGIQLVTVGDNATVVLSPQIINNQRLGTIPISWQSKTLSTLSGENFNSIVNTGISTMPYIVVGDNGLILIFSNDVLDDGNYYRVTPSPTTQNLKSITYNTETETAVVVGTSGSIFTSSKNSAFKTWSYVSSGSTSNLNDIEYFESLDNYLITGNNESLVDEVKQVAAAATAVVSSGGTISSIVISNPGRFYGSSPSIVIEPPNITIERFKYCKIKGDYGKISGITTTSGISTITPAIQFNLIIDSGFSTSISGISTGDYFVTYNTNVGSGVTSILSNGNVVGIGTTFIDCVFRADEVIKDVVSGIVTIISNIKSINGLIGISNTYYSYGDYSWGKIYDFDERKNPISLSANNLNGSSGLSTSPKVSRVTSIGVTIVPLEA